MYIIIYILKSLEMKTKSKVCLSEIKDVIE